jgi:hypothetical protein
MRTLVILLTVFLFVIPVQAKYSGGTGEPNDPYQIATAEDLILLGETPAGYDKHFIMTADIDLDPNLTGCKVFDRAVIAPDTNDSRDWFQGTPFTGIFDGNGHMISNLHIEGSNYLGLFGQLAPGANIKSLGLIEVNIVGSGRCVGGLSGFNVGNVSECYSFGIISGASSVGALVGYVENGVINNCYSDGYVSGNVNVGGLIGYHRRGVVIQCYSSCTISGSSSVGGLVGSGDRGNVNSSFWDIQTSGQVTSTGGTGKTTAQMQNPYTFMNVGWDFVGQIDGPSDIWAEPNDGGYPILWWQQSLLPDLPAFSGGTGVADNPYLISKAEDLNLIGSNPRLMRSHFKLISDINLESVDIFTIGTREFPFCGFFDGNGKRILNFNCFSTDKSYVGLFGCVSGPQAEIKNLGLIEPYINAGTGDYIGSLVGSVNGTINCCYVEGGTITGGQYIGGLVGHASNISNCYSSITVRGDSFVGGLGGSIGYMIHCYSISPVVGDGMSIGGLVGSGTGINSFWDIETSGQTTSGAGKGLTTGEMQMASTFLGWGVCGSENLWTIDEGNDYPRLSWENQHGQVIESIEISDFMQGTGAANDPFLIYTPEQLNMIGIFFCEWNKHFKLMDDLDLFDYPENWFNMIGSSLPFTGIFNGNDHTISNFKSYYDGERHFIGLFGFVSGHDAQIKNLGLIDPDINANRGSSISSLVGFLEKGVVIDCYVEGGNVVGGSEVGGLVGSNLATITNSRSSAQVQGGEGPMGISSCDIGGLVGSNWGTINYCSATGSIMGKTGEMSLGGLVGSNSGIITKCYSTTTVSGFGWMVGGLVGDNYEGKISKCYSTGIVNGNNDVGGLVGYNWPNSSDAGSTAFSFWDMESSRQTISAGGEGKTTAEMQTATTFLEAGWDFVSETANSIEDIWWIDEGNDYPRLWWELTTEN